jgi:hypothetical protein
LISAETVGICDDGDMKEEYSPKRKMGMKMENTLNGEKLSGKVSSDQSQPH